MIPYGHFILVALLLSGPGRTRTIEAKEIKDTVDRFVHSKMDSAGLRFSMEYRSIPGRIPNVPRQSQLRVVASPSRELRNGIMLPVEVYEANHVTQTFLVSLRIRTYGQVLLAAGKVEKWEPANAIAVKEETIETTMVPGDIISTHEWLNGKRAKQMIVSGAILTEDMFESIPLVSQGRPLTLIVKSNNVIIKTTAISREDGSRGDLIYVQKAGSGERLKARVLDAGTVEIMAQN